MKSVYRATTAAICALLAGFAFAQGVSTNGTILLDYATSRTRFVVDAFANSSNKVYELIQNVSPTPDFTTNNQMLVDTIVDVSSAPYLSDFVLKSELTNDVCNIVTNASTRWCIEQPSEWELYDTPAFDGMDRWWVRAVIDGNTEICFSVGNEQSTRLDFYRTNLETLEDEEVFVAVLKTINTLGLARLTDLSPSVSNIVTKAFVEDLGIESGVDAHTVTNISYSITTNYVDNALTNRPTKAQLDEGWWSGWTVVCGGVDVTSQVLQPERFASDVSGWNVPTEYPTYVFGDVLYDETTGYGDGTVLLEWTSNAGSWTAVRHRVAAPVPTKISDITNDTGFVTASITNGLASTSITNGLATATITNGLIGADAISTNNAAFVAAVTNCPVVIADPGDISGWGAYGTVGALLAALAAAITGLRTSKEDASNKVTSLSAQSTDAQYPSAKCVWDMVGDVEAALAAINGTENGGSGT